MPLADFLATLTEFTARSIAHAYAQALRLCDTGTRIGEVIVSGGGARNGFLLERVRACVREELGYDVRVSDHESIGVDSDAKGLSPSSEDLSTHVDLVQRV